MHPSGTRHGRAVAVTIVGLVAAALGGCGSGSAPDSSEPAIAPAPAISVPADAKIDGRAAAPSRSDEPEKSAQPEDADEARACATLQQAWTATNRALVDLSLDHPRSLVSSFRDAERSVTSAEPPAEIEPAWTAMAGYLGDVVEAFDDVDTDDAEAVSAAMADAVSPADTTRATEAAKDITAHLASTCGNG